MEGLHKAFLDRAVTLFAPNNQAMRRFRGRRNENLILNHMTNVAIFSNQVIYLESFFLILESGLLHCTKGNTQLQHDYKVNILIFVLFAKKENLDPHLE